MYLFEQKIGRFKRTVKNTAKVKGSICQAYILKRHLTFALTALSCMSNLGKPKLVGMTMVMKAQLNQLYQYLTNQTMLLDGAKIDV